MTHPPDEPTREELLAMIDDINEDIYKLNREIDGLVDLKRWVREKLKNYGDNIIDIDTRRRKVDPSDLRDYIRKEKRVTIKQIAAHFGISTGSVRLKIKPLIEAGIVMRVRGDSPHEPDEFIFIKPSPYPGPYRAPRTEGPPSAEGKGIVPRGTIVPGTGRQTPRSKIRRPNA